MIGHSLKNEPLLVATPDAPRTHVERSTPLSGFIWPARCQVLFETLSTLLQFLSPILSTYRNHERSNRRVHSLHGSEAWNVRNCYPTITPPKLTAQRTALVCERKSWFSRSHTIANLSSLRFCFLSQRVSRTASWSLVVMDDTGIQRLCN